MPGRTEASIQRSVVTYAREKGLLAIKLGVAGAFGTDWWPDYMFITKLGGVFMVEFKRAGGQPTPRQVARHQQLLDHKVQVSVVDDVARGKWLIDRWARVTE